MTDPHPPDEGAPSTDPADDGPPPDAKGDATAGEREAAAQPDTATVDPAPGVEEPVAADDDASEVDTPRKGAGVPALLRSRRTPVLAAATLIVVAVVVTLVVTIPGEDDRPVPGGAMPTLASQFAVLPPASSAPAPSADVSVPTYQGTALWTVRLPVDVDDHDLPGFAVTDHGYVLQQDENVLGVDRSGKQTWRFAPPETDYLTVRVTGAQVLVGYANPDEDRWPQPEVIIALDAATGKELWRETEASLWSATTDTVYMSVCHGGQNDRVGDCTLSARDPRSNAVRWRVPTYASSRVVNHSHGIQTLPTPPRLLVEAYPTGADSVVVSAHDPATGATLGDGFTGSDARIGQIDAPSARTVVTIDDDDENPADGCQVTVTGFAASGAEKWRHAGRAGKENDGRRCARMYVSYHDGRMGITAANGAPGVLNLDTGAIEWSAPAGGEAVAATSTTLLVLVPRKDPATGAELVAYQAGDTTPRWRAPFPADAGADTVWINGGTAVFTGSPGNAVGYDLGSGKSWSYQGTVVQETPDWLAVCGGSTCRGYAIG